MNPDTDNPRQQEPEWFRILWTVLITIMVYRTLQQGGIQLPLGGGFWHF